MTASYIEESKQSWSGDNSVATHEQIKIGCFQRIANATELMSKNYLALQRDLDHYKRSYEQERNYRQKLERSINSLRGVITRQKKKLAENPAG